MTEATHLSQFLTERPFVLWVEDQLTKEYLTSLWEPEIRDFNILIGGGKNSIRGIVKDMRETNRLRHVFGYADRDFNNSNHAKWFLPESGISVFVANSVEIENYLLDWDAMAGCSLNTNGKTVAQIRIKAESYACTMKYWMVCRKVLSDYRTGLIGTFPSHPKINDIQSLEAAEEYIRSQPPDGSPWIEGFQSVAEKIMAHGSLGEELSAALALYDSILSRSKWVTDFSGKEIYRNVRGFVYQGKRGSTSVELDVDLAKSIAEYQLKHGTIPQELSDLKEAVKFKVGLSRE